MADRGMAKQSKGRRIAMWSGPRNISTAMMRSFGSRRDTVCFDEPFYAWYLKKTMVEHPLRDEIIDHHISEWEAVVDQILGPIPGGKEFYFLKTQPQQMMPEVSRKWFSDVEHFFLIRDPEMIVRSYAASRTDFVAGELGIKMLREIFDEVTALNGKPPPVVSSEDILADPRKTLMRLCEHMDMPFDEAMLSWKPGSHLEDGIWGPHWYRSVLKSTGFGAPSNSPHPLPEKFEYMLPELQAHYEVMLKHKL